jgi:plasmid maintenance system killer protein
MNHLTLPRFWKLYDRLPKEIQLLADKNYELLKRNPLHPSLHFKKIGGRKHLWSVRINDNYRALGVEKTEGIVWFWIGDHSEYEQILNS